MSPAPITATEIRAFRRSVGWSKPQLADALGVSLRTVEEWERFGSERAPAYLRLALAALNHHTPSWISPVRIARTDDGYWVVFAMADKSLHRAGPYDSLVAAELKAEAHSESRPRRRGLYPAHVEDAISTLEVHQGPLSDAQAAAYAAEIIALGNQPPPAQIKVDGS